MSVSRARKPGIPCFTQRLIQWAAGAVMMEHLSSHDDVAAADGISAVLRHA
jgi:hypothetical protein